MKTIDNFRSTNSFCISGIHTEHLSHIYRFFLDRDGSESICAVGHEAKNGSVCDYTVRTSVSPNLAGGGLFDYRVSVIGREVRILERHVLQDWAAFGAK